MNRSRHNETFMRLATALHSHAVRAEKPATYSVIPDRFYRLLRRTDCATGYTVHRRRNNFWTLEIVDPLELDEISSTQFTTADRIDWPIGLLWIQSENYFFHWDESVFVLETFARRRVVCAESRQLALVVIIIQELFYPTEILLNKVWY